MQDDHQRDYLYQQLTSSLASCITSLGGVQLISVEQWRALQGCENARLVMLTLSGYSFRCLVCLVADSSTATRNMTDDELQEQANNLCGTLKRYLGASLQELGMSTPNALPVGCIAYLHEAEHPVMAARAVAADGTVLNACLLVLQVDDNWSPPSAAQLAEPEPLAVGELELF